jgi:hypothetical protein
LIHVYAGLGRRRRRRRRRRIVDFISWLGELCTV